MSKFAYKKYIYPHDCHFSGRIFEKTLGSNCTIVFPALTLNDNDYRNMFISVPTLTFPFFKT